MVRSAILALLFAVVWSWSFFALVPRVRRACAGARCDDGVALNGRGVHGGDGVAGKT